MDVLVPRRHLSQVYGFIAQLDNGEGQSLLGGPTADTAALATAAANGAAASTVNSNEWTPSRLRRMVDESSPALLEILKALANRPGDWLPMDELAKGIGPAPIGIRLPAHSVPSAGA